MKPAISIRPAVHFAWSTFKQRYTLFAELILILFAAWVTLEVIVIVGQPFGFWLWFLAHLAFLVFFAGVLLGFARICLDLYDGSLPKFSDAFTHFASGPKLLAGQILYLLVVLAGLVLFVAPGIYLGIRYAWFGFSLASGETSLRRSFEQSAALSRGTIPSLLLIFAALVGFNLLGASLLGVGLFVSVPVSFLALSAFYRQLTER